MQDFNLDKWYNNDLKSFLQFSIFENDDSDFADDIESKKVVDDAISDLIKSSSENSQQLDNHIIYLAYLLCVPWPESIV